MPSLFLRQFGALFVKNWIVLRRHLLLNILRCLILPIAYGVFLAVAQEFLVKPNNYGIGDPVAVYNFSSQFDPAYTLYWADATNGQSNQFASPSDIMSRVTAGFSSTQLGAVKEASSADIIPSLCPQNFNLFSECWAAIVFNSLPTGNGSPINYTIRADGGLFHIDVVRHTSDYEKRILPMQWAVDSAIMELRTGQTQPTPQEWAFTQETNKEQSTHTRLSYIRGLRTLLVLALFIDFVGIVYQLPGSFMGERALGLTSHLKVMGLLDSARILSWLASIVLAYLPAWTIVSLIWHYQIFTGTNGGLVFVIHLVMGLSLASWSLFVGTPFGKSPQLAAVASTFLAIVFAIFALVLGAVGDGTSFVFTLVFPPAFYIFAVRSMAGFEVHQIPTNVLDPDPDSGMRLLPILIAGIIDIFMWPYLAVLLERRLYDARNPVIERRPRWKFWQRHPRVIPSSDAAALNEGTAISVRNLRKTFAPPLFRKTRGEVVAVDNLSFDVPKHGIFVLLGSNGAGKSTTLSILAGLLGRTSGSVVFEDGGSQPPRGALGVVPQKNVLFPELNCLQTLRVWQAVKHSKAALGAKEDLAQLLIDCDLVGKADADAQTLSGGQKRKLQLAIGLVGGSKIVLVDECTSGVDPLSRRALWRTLTSVRHERTVIFTTHFLDEADLLADEIAILAAPGTLVASGSPVALKSSLGEGYTVVVSFDSEITFESSRAEVLERIRAFAPETRMSSSPPHRALYHLHSKNTADVERTLQILEEHGESYGVSRYDIQGTSIEDIFLNLMHDPEKTLENLKAESPTVETRTATHSQRSDGKSLASTQDVVPNPVGIMSLARGRKLSPWRQATTIFHKRYLITRRSWLTPLIMLIVAIAGACVPLFFMANRPQSCHTTFVNSTSFSLFLPTSPISFLSFLDAANAIRQSPPGLIRELGDTMNLIAGVNYTSTSDFTSAIQQNYRNLTRGGVAIDANTNQALVAWEASPPGITGPIMLNLASNLLFNRVLGSDPSTPSIIQAYFEAFPPVDTETLVALKWVGFFGAAMSVYPAFFSLYVSRERRSSVQAMQFSNGLSNPVGLWIGHAMFDSLFVFFISTIITVVFATASNQFHGLGFFWFILVLYGVAGALFAYMFSLMTASPLAAFAIAAGYQIIMFTAYVAAYLLTLTYAKTSQASSIITTLHFALSVLSPAASIIRAAFVSVNLFSLACTGDQTVTASQLGVLKRFGGPILYLIVYSLILLAVLVWADSGSVLYRTGIRSTRRRSQDAANHEEEAASGDIEEKDFDAPIADDALCVDSVSKAFGTGRHAKTVVDDVSIGVAQDTIFALLGPNGAGKTTTFNIIRGEVIPERGDVLLNGVSVIRHPRSARLALGVCPQFTAIDSQLTVREHLLVYARLKGLGKRARHDVEAIMEATALAQYAERLASQLSGGNQRKLALSIALIGNPSVILIDEFSTGIDAKMKREMWVTLQRVAVGKAIIITTHSMEEAAALANRVGIIAKRLLASGTTESLIDQYAVYEVHLSCRTREDLVRARALAARIPGARMADDVATRLEVPITDGGLSLAQLFHVLAAQDDFADYSVERASLESVFLKVIRANNVVEQDAEDARARRGRGFAGLRSLFRLRT